MNEQTRIRSARAGSHAIALLALGAAAGFAAGVLLPPFVRTRFGPAPPGPGAAEPGAQPAAQLWTCGMHPQVIQEPGICPICHMDLTPLKVEGLAGAAGGGPPSGTAPPDADRKVKYWWDPMMNPPYISDRPGKSPMGMDLVPVYEDEVRGGSSVVIDPVVVQNMGVRTATVTEGALRRSIRAVGYLDEAQPNIRDINLRVSGWIRRLYADTEGMRLEEGDPLFDLYSPELRVAVEELITARRALDAAADDAARRSPQVLYDAAFAKLLLFDLSREQVEGMAGLDRSQETVTFTSPISGELIEKPVVTGAAVMAGDMTLRIVDRSTLWLDAQFFEKDLPLIEIGQKVEATVASRPGEPIEGYVIFIHPNVDPMTRTATVRVALPNPDLTLRPGMYSTVRLEVQLAERALMVPREAVIDTGERQVAFVTEGGGRFEPRRVVMGHASDGGMVQVMEGLAPGERVVTSGQFLLDSESRLREAVQKFLGERRGAPAETPAPAHEHGAAPSPGTPQPHVPEVDAVLSEYLKLSETLGAPQVSDAPLNAEALVQAAHRLHAAAAESGAESLAARVAGAAEALRDQAIDGQRERFKALSDAVIALVERHPASAQVRGPLFVMYCPMAPGSWIQATETVNNPYYATSMKRCGEVRRTITPGAAP